MDGSTLETAFKNLDLLGDGVINIQEFSRWYFSGMQSYGSNKRSLLKFHGQAAKIFEIAKRKARLALVGKELKVKSHKISLGFNELKEKVGATIDFKV